MAQLGAAYTTYTIFCPKRSCFSFSNALYLLVLIIYVTQVKTSPLFILVRDAPDDVHIVHALLHIMQKRMHECEALFFSNKNKV